MAPKNPSKTTLRASEPVAGKVGHRRPGPGGQQSASDEVQETERALSVGMGLASVALAVYVKTAYPTVPGGDAGELCFASCSLAIAHPPGQEPNKNRSFVHRGFCRCIGNHLQIIHHVPCISSPCPAPSSSLCREQSLDCRIPALHHGGAPLDSADQFRHSGLPCQLRLMRLRRGRRPILLPFLPAVPPPGPSRDHPPAAWRGGNAKQLGEEMLRLQGAKCLW